MASAAEPTPDYALALLRPNLALLVVVQKVRLRVGAEIFGVFA